MKATPRELILDAYERIQDMSRWTQGPVARNSTGLSCSPSDPDACQWCAAGSLSKSAAGATRSGKHFESATQSGKHFESMVGDPEVHKAVDALDRAAQELYGLRSFVNVNERLGHAAILEVFVAALRDSA